MDPISQSQTPSGASARSADPTEKAAALTSDFETFIRMLTTQMQNQDPLNPMESADFATQLATFSGVEQQVKTNDLLSALGSQMGALNLSQLSGWVGMDARAVMPVKFEGAPVPMRIQGSATAQSHQLVVRDESGSVLSRQDVAGNAQDILWQGRSDFGSALPRGTYEVAVESFDQGELVGTNPVELRGRIVEARPESGQVSLVFESGQEVSSDRILALKRPSDA